MGNIVIDTDEEIIGDMKERSEENAQNEAQRNKPTKINGEKSTRIVQKGMSLLRTKSRDNGDTESTVGQPPDGPGKANSFCEQPMFISLKQRKFPLED